MCSVMVVLPLPKKQGDLGLGQPNRFLFKTNINLDVAFLILVDKYFASVHACIPLLVVIVLSLRAKRSLARQSVVSITIVLP